MNSRLWTATAVSALAAAVCAAPAAAQGPNEPRVTITAAAGVADPLHSDFQFNAPSWQLGVRWTTTPLVACEAGFAEWRHAENSVRQHLQVQGPGGAIGSIDRFAEDEQYVTRTVGLNVLVRHSRGRLTVWGGGGPAYVLLEHQYKQTLSGCQGDVPCRDFATAHSAGAFAVQGTAGADVRVSRRLAAFVQYAFVLPVEDPGAGHVGVSGGIRLAIW